MHTLHDRLAELADDAPRGGAPAAELWARGRRAQRRRAAALVAASLMVGAVGLGVGVRLLGGAGDHSRPEPARTLGVALPIEYPAGEELPDLGDAPGALAAVWLAPREPYTLDDDDAGLAPEAVGLVAETGRFGTLPIDLHPWVYEAPDARFALSPDGRRIAYYAPGGGPETAGELVVQDLVTGESFSPAFDFGIRAGATWVDNTHLVGHVAGGSDGDGWVWKRGTAPRRVDPYPYFEGVVTMDSPFLVVGGDPPWSCTSPTISDDDGRSEASVLCDVLGGVGSELLLGHLDAGTDDLNRAVVAVDISDGADFPFDDPALRRVVVDAGAPHPVAFATDLLGQALAGGGTP